MPTGFPDYYGGLTLPVTVPEGGTGYTTITAHTVLVGNDAGKLTLVAPGTAGTVLASNGAALDPSFQTVPAGSILAGAGISIAGSPPTITNSDDAYFSGGVLAIAHGGTGTPTPGLVAGAGISISGSWPDQTITNSDDAYFAAGVLAIAHGGTGTATPALVAGAGISISGFWPNQTITNSDDAYFSAGVLAIAHGGTGTATPALVAGAGISISGSWPNQTITNSDDAYFAAGVLAVAHGGTALSALGTALQVLRVNTGATALEYHAVDLATAMVTGILPVANGGTGTATPALVAGSNIAISGAWPDQTIALQSAVHLGTAGTPDSGGLYIASAQSGQGFTKMTPFTDVVAGITGTLLEIVDAGRAILVCFDQSGNLGLSGTLQLGTPLAVSYGGTGTATPGLVAGAGISISGSWPDQTITNTDDAYFAAGVLAIAHGGTGAASFAAAGLVSIVAKADKTGQTGALLATTLYTPGTAGMYRITAEIYVADPSASADRVTASVTFTQNGVAFTAQIADTTSKAAAHFVASGLQAMYCDASTAIQYSTTATLGAGDSYDVHFRLEAIG